MPFTVDPQPGEEVYVLKEFRGSHGHVFAMAVSNQAIYLPTQKLVLKRDAWCFRRVRLSEVTEVNVRKQKAVWIYLMSAGMIIFGGVATFMMMRSALLQMPGSKVSGLPIAILVCGLVVPFIARGRATLVVKLSKGRFKWKPQLAVDKKTRETQAKIQDDILQACKKALLKIKPYLQAFLGTNVGRGLIDGSTVIAMDWDFDVALNKQKQPKIEWVNPSEGMTAYLEGWMAVKGTKYLPLIEEFMNFALGPKQYASFVNTTGSAYVEPAARQYIEKALATSPIIAPDPAVLRLVEYETYLGNALPMWESTWQEIKA